MPDRNVEAMFPLSPSQQGILFESLAAPESGMHIEQVRWRIDGEFDVTRFEKAWQHVAEQRSILRTGFWHKDLEQPVQFVLRQVVVPVGVHDWRDSAASQQDLRLNQFLELDRRRGFQLARAPLVRVEIFRVGEGSHQIVLTFHHILLDGWSVPLLAREALIAYECLGNGGVVALDPDRPYRDYLSWLQSQDRSRAETYWRQTLAGFTAPTALGRPSDNGSISGSGFGEKDAGLPSAPTAALRSLARRNQVTLNTVVQGVWSILLSRYSGDADVVFGTTVSGRPPSLPGTEAMLGLFVNTVPRRIEVPAAGGVWPWLHSMQRAALDQSEFEIWSAGQIHQWSGAPGSKPLFESILVFENYPFEGGIGARGLSIRPAEASAVGAQTRYPLAVLAVPGETLTLRVVFHRRRFDEQSIGRILDHACRLLAAIASEPDVTVEALRDSIPVEEIPTVRNERAGPRDAMPRNTTEERLARIWADVLGLERVGIHDGFFDLGGHSLLLARLIARIREEFQVDVPLNVLLERPDVAQIARWLDESDGHGAPWPDCLLALQPQGTKTPLFWTPPAAGTPICYSEMARFLSPDQPCYGLQCPGIADDRKPLDRIADMAALFVDAVRVVQPRGPYRIAGWSFGGPVAFEMARILEQRGEEVELLLMLDTGVIDTTDRHWKNQLRISLFPLLVIVYLLQVKPPTSYRELRRLATWVGVSLPERGRDFFRGGLRSSAKYIRRFVADALSSMRVFRSNMRAAIRYLPAPYGGRAIIFRAGKKQSPGDIVIKGSTKFISGGITVIRVKGNHMTMMMNEDNARYLSAELKNVLEEQPPRAVAGVR